MKNPVKIGDVFKGSGHTWTVKSVVRRCDKQDKIKLTRKGYTKDMETFWTENELYTLGVKRVNEVNMAEKIKKLSLGKEDFFCACWDNGRVFTISRGVSKGLISRRLLQIIKAL